MKEKKTAKVKKIQKTRCSAYQEFVCVLISVKNPSHKDLHFRVVGEGDNCVNFI